MAAVDQVILLLLLLSSLSLFNLGKAENNITDTFTCYDCVKQKTKGNETITIISHDGKLLTECGKIECKTTEGQKCYELTNIPESQEETSTSVHVGCGADKTEVCTAISSSFTLEECKSDWVWETCDKDLCNKGSVMNPVMLTTVVMVTMAQFLYQ